MTLEQKIVEYLCEKYHPSAIILHGSRARRMHKELSDWDIYLLVQEPLEASTEIFEEQNLDVEAITIPVVSEKIVSLFGGRLRAAKILFDNEGGFGKDFLVRAEELYASDFSLNKDQYEDRKNFLWRRLERLRAYQDEPGVFFVHLGIFFNASLRYWFEVRHLWSEPVYVALPYILEHDSKLHLA